MLKIYQILIDRFRGNIVSQPNGNIFMGGNLQGVIEELDHIAEMGFNTILLSPFTKTTNYHGYHVEDYYEVEPSFGDRETLDNLIKCAHDKGLRLMMDFVPNHCSVKHPFFIEAITNKQSKYRNWFYIDNNNNYTSFLDFKELAKFNLDNKGTEDYLVEVCRHWCRAGFDYVRIDHVIGVPFLFLNRLCAEIKAINSDIKIYGEALGQGLQRRNFKTLNLKRKIQKYLFGINQEELQRDYIGALDGVIDFEFMNIVTRALSSNNGVNFEQLQQQVTKHLSRYPKNFDLLLLLDNHDTNRILHYIGKDEKMLLQLIEFMTTQNRSFSIYYGTESMMQNTISVHADINYADLSVREPYQLSKPILSEKMRDILLYTK